MTTASLILRRRARLPLALAGCLALGAHATVAFAATSPETAAATTADAAPDAADRNTAETLDKIEVKGVTKGYATDRSATATKTDTPLQDIPQSISVVTQDLIRDQAMQNMGDVVRYIPGFGMAQGEGNRDAPILRGTASTADFFVDGVRDDVQYFRDLYNVERVEGLKGPNAMIFGRGGSGGLINRVTKQADWNDVGEVSVLLGSWSNRRSTVDFGRALSDDAAFRVTGLYENSDSYRDGTGIERYGVNPTFAFRAGENTRITLGYEHFKDERVADRGIPSLGGRPLETDPSTFFGDPQQSPTWAKVNAFSALIEHDFGNGALLRNRTRYADYDKFYQNVFPGAVNAANSTVAISAYNNLTTRQNLINQTDLTFSVDTGGMTHRFLTGVELADQDTDNFRETGYFPPAAAGGTERTSVSVPLSNPRTNLPVVFRQSATDADNQSTAKTAAVYVQDQIEFSPQWQAIVGLRYDSFKVDFHNNRNNSEIDSSDGLVSPRAGLIYKPAETVSLYGSYSIAYVPRAGEQLASLSPTNAAFDPEKFKNFEIGAKWEVSSALSATAAVYRLDRSNVVAPDPADPTRSILVKGQRVKGVELGLAGQVTENWRVLGAYAWQDGEVLQTQSATVQAGATLAQVPRNTFSLWNRYDFSPRWGAGLGALYRSTIFTSTDNLVELPGFTRFDAALFFRVSDNVDTQLNVENLLDRKYYASAHSNNNITPGSPRAFRFSLNARF
ncbi:TonB-dependent receptor [Tahibacter sp. UC22_41]|uniref:TonB-dependent receptor n=1 Tax=Tahibacter sp. UC22_41 TaxID=3350178 RepID=UPI0036DD7329